MQHITNQLSADLSSKIDNELKTALAKHGFDASKLDPNDFEFIITEGDPFEHLYYKPGTNEQRRIISIEKEVKISFKENADGNTVSVHADRRFY